MRLYAITSSDVTKLIVSDHLRGVAGRGNLLYEGEIRGRRIAAVLASDDMDTVVTVYDMEA